MTFAAPAGRPPGAPQCRFCSAPLTPDRAAVRACGAPACDSARVQEASRAVFARDWQSYVEGQRLALEEAGAGLAAAAAVIGAPPERIAFGVVPRQENAPVPLPEGRRAAFAAHLGRIVAEAFAEPEPASDSESRDAGERPEEPLIDAACATCQGKCCFLGGDRQAFLTAETIQLFRARNPGATAAAVAAHYLGRLPGRSVGHSCVYHGERGCTLPRAERADICNRYHCNQQTQLLRRYRETGAAGAVIVARDDEAGPTVAVFDAAGWRPLAPGAGGAADAAAAERALSVALAQTPRDLADDGSASAPACAWCGAAIDRRRAASRQSCGRPACERGRLAEAAVAIDRREGALREAQLRRLRERLAPELVRTAAQRGGPVALGALPHLDAALAPLPPERRRRFEQHVDAMIEAGFANRARLDGAAGAADHALGSEPAEAADGAGHAQALGPAEAADRTGGADGAQAPESPAVAAACATCGGSCCRGGWNTAFLDAAQVVRARRRAPGLTAQALRERWLARLPEQSVAGSCVYHAARGCALPREDRSETCNRFRCRGLEAMLGEIAVVGARSVVLVSTDRDGNPLRVAVAEAGTDAAAAPKAGRAPA